MAMNRLLGIATLVMVAGGLSACGNSEERVEAKAAEPVAVTVAPVTC